MVTGGNDRIQLELTVDKAELEKQLGQLFQTPVGPLGPGAAGAAGGAAPGTKGRPAVIEAGGKTMSFLGNLAKLSGVAIGITALVKNSQVLGTTVGALNTTLFAIVDSFLAPLVPLLIPALNKIAELIGPAQRAGQVTAETTGGVIEVTKELLGAGGRQGKELRDAQKTFGLNVAKDLLDFLTPQAFGQDLFRGPTQQRMRAAGIERGGDPISNLAFGIAEFMANRGTAELGPAARRGLSNMSESEVRRLISRPAVQANFNISLDNIDDIVSEVRSELERISRDQYSRGFLGGGG